MKRLLTTFAIILLLASTAVVQKAYSRSGDTITTKTGLKYIITRHGKGKMPTDGQIVIAQYTGSFLHGKVFDSSRERNEPFSFKLGAKQVIAGWDEGFRLLHVGDRATFIIPPELGYGDKDKGPIPANSTLVFDVELVALDDHSLSEVLAETIEESGIQAAVEQYRELKKKKFPHIFVSESELNMLGYALINKDSAADAIEILKLNVESYPESANVYDSLGEAYMNSGNKDLAIVNYKKSLELDPKNTNAKVMLEKLQGK